MRKLIVGAVTAAALAVPSGASAQTADPHCLTPVVPCLQETIDELYCPGSCIPNPVELVCDVIFGPGACARDEATRTTG